MKCCLDQQHLWEFQHVDGGAAFVVNRWSVETFFEKAVEIRVFFGHVEFADPVIMIDEDVSLRAGVGDCATVMRHGFIGRVGIWCAVKALNDFPYIWAVSI